MPASTIEAAAPAERPALDWAAQPPVRPCTICHPVFQLGRGGLERQLLQTIHRLPADRFRHVLVIRGRDAGSIPREIPDPKNIRVIADATRDRDRLWFRRLAAILRDEGCDAVHVRGTSMLTDAVLAARRVGGLPVAFSFHGFERPTRSFGIIRRTVLQASLRRCAAWWAVSRSAAASVAKTLRIDADRFEVLPNGVDTERFVPTARRYTIRRELNLPADRRVILTVANLKPVKGHRVLFDALAGLRSFAGRVTLVLVGADYLDGSLRQMAETELPEFDIRFAGRHDDVLPWLQTADLFVLPSLYEGLSNALLEAMACGVPVIATDVGGNPEVIEHGRTGLLVPPGDAVELATALRYLLEDDDLRALLGGMARTHVRRHYSAEAATRCYEERYAALGRRADIEPPPGQSRD